MELNQPSTMEEEAIKRNTDCVYFLASPLTCKKGSECEYRHSETARINPRDCWYWMNGNCLNPKCAFRHPPLDGLLGTAGTVNSAGPSMPQPVANSSMHAPAYVSSKQNVPCIYFQKGLCLKGDKCPFMHGSQPAATPATPQTAKAGPSFTEPPQIPKKSSNEPMKPIFQQKSPQKNIVKPVEEMVPIPVAKPIYKPEISLDNGIRAKINTPLDDMFVTKFKANNAPVFGGLAAINRPVVTLEDRFPVTEESDEFLAESSPGFDVLVDDELEESDYYLNEDAEFRRTADLGIGRDLSEFDYNRHSPVFVDSLAKYDREPQLDLGDYEFYGRPNDRFGWEQRRASSERILERQSMPERRGLLREQSPNQIGGSDLRHRLSKRRRVNDGSSRVGDHHNELYRRDNDRLLEEQRYRGHSRRDPPHVPSEGSISRRLQGRITLPNRSSPDRIGRPFDSKSDMDAERGRIWGGRSSPGRTGPYLRRHNDRMKRRTPEDISTTEGRNFRSQQPTRRDEVNFAGPKSLAELKNAKVSAPLRSQVVHEEQKSLRVAKALGSHQEPESSLPFEGPKPLSMILKRKREVSSGNGDDSSNKEETNQMEAEEVVAEVAQSQVAANAQQSTEAGKEANYSQSCNEEPKGFTGIDRLAEEGLDSATSARGDSVHSEEDLTIEEAMEDQDIEGSDQRDGESEGNWKTEENGEIDDEFLDDEDGDDFARRLGVMFS